ncbi:hypothetical protein BCR36DRAFT_349493 [Piromyces finnis]|uniref:Zn(2)-C6 fungal-type domain-containing protein n=1 Tax=Piromyces finnis TaxID=1754191 RepID=A0A1Y1VCH1_9FUNG|nr:hypothetical protein BCR36DRAFT_349493 [Piromyces finnis]|eukprot:ORX52886.1 hypothetical protein BCR36DRAFT_349493 [Piromyces finnis]
MGYSYPYRNNSSNKSSVPQLTPVAPYPNIQLPITNLPVVPITSATASSSSSSVNDTSNQNKFKTFPNVKRKRTAQACNACRRKRIKCDGKSPCTQCIQHKIESECCFAQPLKRGPRKGSTRVNLKERLHKVEELLYALTSKQNIDEMLAAKSAADEKAKLGGKSSQSTSTINATTVTPITTTESTPATTNTSASLLSQKSLAASLLNNGSKISTSSTPILPNPTITEAAASTLLNTNTNLSSSTNNTDLLNALQTNANVASSSSLNNTKDNNGVNVSNINSLLFNSLLLNQQQQQQQQQQQTSTIKNSSNKATTNSEGLAALQALTQQQQLLSLASQNPGIDLMSLASLQSNGKLKSNILKNNKALNNTTPQLSEIPLSNPATSSFPTVLPSMSPSPKSLLETAIPISPALSGKNNKRKSKMGKRVNVPNKKIATSVFNDQINIKQDNIIDLANNIPTSSTNKIAPVNTINVKLEEEILKSKMKGLGKINGEKNDMPYMTSSNSITIPSSWTNTEATNVSSSTSSIYKNLMNNNVKKETEISSNTPNPSVSNLPFIKVSSQTPIVSTNPLYTQDTINKPSSNAMNMDILKNSQYNLSSNNDKLLNTTAKDMLNQTKTQQILQNTIKNLLKSGVIDQEFINNNPIYSQLLMDNNLIKNSAQKNVLSSMNTDPLSSNLESFNLANPIDTNTLGSSYTPTSTTNIASNMLLSNEFSNFPINSLSPVNSPESDKNSNINALTKAKFNIGQNKTSPLISQNGLTIPSDNTTSMLVAEKNANIGLDFLNTINNTNSLNSLNINNLYRNKLLSSFNPLNSLNNNLQDNIFMYNINPELLQNYPFGINGNDGNLLKPAPTSKEGTEDKKTDEKTYKGDLGVAFIDMKSSGGYIYFGNSSCVGLASNLINDLSSEKKSASFSFNDIKNILASVSNRKEDGSDIVNINSRVEDVTPITTKENFKKILDLFFDYLQPIIPLFNRQVFTSFLDNDPDAPGYQLLLHCILAVVGKYIPKEELPKDLPENISQLAFDWARNQLQKVFDIPSLPTVQALIILSTLAMSNPRSEMGYSTYTYTGTAVRMAHELGLHRDLMLRGQDHTLEEKNETRRAWVLLYVLDRQSALMTGRPMIIDDSDWDIPPPTIDSNEATDVEKATVQALLVRLELFEIVGEISRWSNAGKRKASQETDPLKKEKFVINHQRKLTEWRNSIPEFLQWTDPPYLYEEESANPMKNEFTFIDQAATDMSNKADFKIPTNDSGSTLNNETNSPSTGLNKSPKGLVWTMFPLYLAAIYYRAQLTLHVYSLTSSSITPTVLQSKKICTSAAIYLTNIIISMMAITPEPHPLCSFFLAQLPTTIMTCISVQLFIVKSNNWSIEERQTATKAILNNIQLLKISKVQPLGTYLYAYAKWIVRKANIEINESDLEHIDAMNANTTTSNLKTIYSSIHSITKNKKENNVDNNDNLSTPTSTSTSTNTNSSHLSMSKMNSTVPNSSLFPTSPNYIESNILNDPVGLAYKGKETLNENELLPTENKNIPASTTNIQDDALLNAYREALKHNDPFLTTMDFRDLMQEMNLEL